VTLSSAPTIVAELPPTPTLEPLTWLGCGQFQASDVRETAQATIFDAIAKGEQGMQACADKAESLGFSTEAARAFVINWLAEYGPTAGEDLVEAAEKTGRTDLRGHDQRCWGAVFGKLSKTNRIRCLRSDLPRKRGHGTSGGKLWALVQ
jgi:hypothetical protein